MEFLIGNMLSNKLLLVYLRQYLDAIVREDTTIIGYLFFFKV